MTNHEEKTPVTTSIVIKHQTTTSDAMMHSAVARAYLNDLLMRDTVVGKELCADKMGVLLCNLRLLTKTPKRLANRWNAPRHMEFFDSIAAKGLVGAIESATALVSERAGVDTVLRVLGRFEPLRDCAIAPKGTRSQLEKSITMLSTFHTCK